MDGDEQVDRRLGWLVSAAVPVLLAIIVVPIALRQRGVFVLWWEVLAWSPILASLCLLVAGSRMPMRVLRAFWIGVPAVSIAAQLLSFAAFSMPRSDISPWLWEFEGAVAAYLAVALRPPLAIAGMLISTVSVPLSALVFTGSIPLAVASDAPLQAGNLLFCVLFMVMRRSLRHLHAAEQAARVAAEQRARAAAYESERAVFTRLVHDEVLAVLGAAQYFEGDPPERLRAEAGHALTTVRELPGMPPEVAVSGREALARIVARLREIYPDLQVRVEADSGEVPASLAAALKDAAAEAVRNALRHSAAAHISVEAEVRRGTARVVITDDGRGFDVRSLNSGRFGVSNSIRQRMADAGGEARLHSVPGHGTRVDLSWTS